MSQNEQDSVHAWHFQDVLLETYHYAPGRREDVPRHAHEEYQLGLNLTHPGAYRYRGAKHPIPVGSLSVLHPGEAHATNSSFFKETNSRYRMLFVSPALFSRAADDVAGRETALPFFPAPILLDLSLAQLFLRLHRTLEEGGGASLLEQESLLLWALARLIAQHARSEPEPRRAGRPSGAALDRAHEYLRAHCAENVSLEELARVAQLSPYHLSRAFRQRFGMPPHAYQIQARIEQAKRLLTAGHSPPVVALETGFYDQSHFGRHFRRLVSVTPGVYAAQQQKRPIPVERPLE